MLRATTVVGCVILLCASVGQAGLLSVPAGYTPAKSWPVIVSYQDNPSVEQMETVPYFLVHAGGKGMRATKKTVDNLTSLAKRYNIDPFRIYGTGFSRGGQEVLQQAWEHPHWFAAVAPVCNDLRRKPDRNLKDLSVRYLGNVPALLLHGSGDSFRRTGEILHGHMKQAGGPVTFALYRGGHSPGLPFKQNVKMLTAFFDKHRLDPHPRRVVHIVTHKRYSRAFWVDSALTRDAGAMKGVFQVTVGKHNRIEVAVSRQISALALYLNGKLVDMKKPVMVVLGALPSALVPCFGPEAQKEAGSTSQPVERVLYEGPAVSPLKIKFREGMALPKKPAKLLWERIVEIRAKAKTPATRPAEPKARN